MSEYREVILDACVHCRVSDFLFEGTRAGYMRDVIAELPDRVGYEQAVIESLAEPCGSIDQMQRYCFAAALAKDGNAQALAAMYQNFRPDSEEATNLARQIVHADGLKGFQTIVRSLFDARPDEALFFCEEASDILGAEVVDTALRDAGLKRPVRESHAQRPSKKTPEADLLVTAQELLQAIDSADWTRAKSHLNVFRERTYPLDPEPLLRLAQAEPEAPLRCSRLAMNALKHVTHPAVRKLGLERHMVGLLLANFQPGDHQMALDWYLVEKNGDLAHWMESDLMKLWWRYPQTETESAMLLGIYNQGACSICRMSALERLVELKQLPLSIRQECAWDACDEIRELVRDIS
jgi:hypothetical protein